MQAEASATDNPMRKNFPLILVLLTGSFITILNQTLIGIALPLITIDLHLSESTVQWLQSIFMLVNGIMIPITAFLIEKYTTRALFLTAMGLFTIGTVLAAFSPDFTLLLIGRIFQGAGAGIMMPLMQTVLFLLFPLEKRGSAMGMFGLVISFAPAIGPTLAGWLINQFHWRSVFYVILPIAIITLIAAYFLLKNVTELKNPKVDVLSIILSTLGFGGILYSFSVAGDVGFTNYQVYISLAIGIVALIIFILRQLKLEEPILEFRVFTYSLFTLSTVLSMIVFISMIGAAVILPFYLMNMLGFSPLYAGLALLPGGIIMGLMSPVSGNLFDRFGARGLSIIGYGLLTITTFMFTTLSTETSFAYIAIVNAVRMFAMSMVMMPVTTAGLNVLPLPLIPHGSAMSNTFRQIAGAIGTALLVTIMVTTAKPELGVKGMIHGVNMSFVVAGIISVVGFVLSFWVKKPKEAEKMMQEPS